MRTARRPKAGAPRPTGFELRLRFETASGSLQIPLSTKGGLYGSGRIAPGYWDAALSRSQPLFANHDQVSRDIGSRKGGGDNLLYLSPKSLEKGFGVLNLLLIAAPLHRDDDSADLCEGKESLHELGERSYGARYDHIVAVSVLRHRGECLGA